LPCKILEIKGIALTYSNCCNNFKVENVNAKELEKLIGDKKEKFLKKLKYAGLNELEYWEREGHLSKEILVRYLKGLDENKILFPEMSERESGQGKYGGTGFNWVFKFEDDFYFMGIKIRIYIKGYFFERNYPRGIEIQSFKKSQSKLR
jgi:hypothetical protein